MSLPRKKDTAPPERRKWDEGGSFRIPSWLYSDEQHYRRELELIFDGPFWSYVGLDCEIPKPGDFKRFFVGERPVLVCRANDGSVSVVENRCAHRGAALCQRDSGNTPRFVCPYHKWTFDLDGRLVGVPFQRGVQGQPGMPADFDPSLHGLRRLSVTTRNGVIFASYSSEAPPFEEYLGPKMLPYFDRIYAGRKLVVLGYHRQRIPANWKLMFENIKDPYHASLMHVFFSVFGVIRPGQPNRTEMDETGMHSVLAHQKVQQDKGAEPASAHAGEFVLKDRRVVDFVEEFPDSDSTVVQTIWPNLIMQQSFNGLGPRLMLPRGPSCFDFVWTAIGYESDTPEMTRHRLRQANLFGPSGFVSLDDGEAMEFLQRGLKNYPESVLLAEMGGHSTEDTSCLVTEAAIRKLYAFYRKVMKL